MRGRTGGPEPFELFALRYANHTGRSATENMIGADPHEFGSDLDYFVWVARRSDRAFVIDVGFAGEQARARGRDLIRKPHEAIELIGMDVASVDEVILTHLHYDHAGTLDDFPRARFHVQDAEQPAFRSGQSMVDQSVVAGDIKLKFGNDRATSGHTNGLNASEWGRLKPAQSINLVEYFTDHMER